MTPPWVVLCGEQSTVAGQYQFVPLGIVQNGCELGVVNSIEEAVSCPNRNSEIKKPICRSSGSC